MLNHITRAVVTGNIQSAGFIWDVLNKKPCKPFFKVYKAVLGD